MKNFQKFFMSIALSLASFVMLVTFTFSWFTAIRQQDTSTGTITLDNTIRLDSFQVYDEEALEYREVSTSNLNDGKIALIPASPGQMIFFKITVTNLSKLDKFIFFSQPEAPIVTYIDSTMVFPVNENGEKIYITEAIKYYSSSTDLRKDKNEVVAGADVIDAVNLPNIIYKSAYRITTLMSWTFHIAIEFNDDVDSYYKRIIRDDFTEYYVKYDPSDIANIGSYNSNVYASQSYQVDRFLIGSMDN